MGRTKALKGTPHHFFVAERGQAVRACRRCACDWSDPIHLEPPVQGVRPMGDPEPSFMSNGGPEPQLSTLTFGEGDDDGAA